MAKVIKVNKSDKVLGLINKLKAHQDKGVLHRAFSALVANSKGEILLQKRSKDKMLWPLYWSNTCCSHPQPGEKIKQAAEKRLKEEMGFTLSLKPIFKFQYQAEYRDFGAENEIVTVLLGKYKGEKIIPNSKEVAEFKWRSYQKLIEEIKQKPSQFTPWFKKILKNQKFALKLQELCGK